MSTRDTIFSHLPSGLRFRSNRAAASEEMYASLCLAGACYEAGYEVTVQDMPIQYGGSWARVVGRHMRDTPAFFTSVNCGIPYPRESTEVGRICMPGYKNRSDYADDLDIDIVLANSERCAAQWAGSGAHVVRFPLGVDTALFRPYQIKLSDSCIRWHNGDPEGIIVGIMCTSGYSRLSLAIKAAEIVARDRPVTLVLAYKDWPDTVQTFADYLEVTGSPLKFGSVMATFVNPYGIARIMSFCDVFLHGAGFYDNFGIYPLHAMACGSVPVIGSHVSSSQFARDGENCIVLKDDIRNDAVAADEVAKALVTAADTPHLRPAGLDTARRTKWDAAWVEEASARILPAVVRSPTIVRAPSAGAAPAIDLSFCCSMRNSHDDLTRLLDCYRRWRGVSCELLIYDDASAPRVELDAGEMARDNIRVIRSEVNMGAEWGRFVLYHEAQGRYCLSLDVDMLPEPGPNLLEWFETIEAAVETDLVLAPVLTTPAGTIWSAGSRSNPHGAAPSLHRMADEPISNLTGHEVYSVVSVPGACFMARTQFLRRRQFAATGSYHPQLAYEDCDLIYAVRHLGGATIAVYTDWVWRHNHGSYTLRQAVVDERRGAAFRALEAMFNSFWADACEHDVFIGLAEGKKILDYDGLTSSGSITPPDDEPKESAPAMSSPDPGRDPQAYPDDSPATFDQWLAGNSVRFPEAQGLLDMPGFPSGATGRAQRGEITGVPTYGVLEASVAQTDPDMLPTLERLWGLFLNETNHGAA